MNRILEVIRLALPKNEYAVAGAMWGAVFNKLHTGTGTYIMCAVAYTFHAWDLMNYKQDES